MSGPHVDDAPMVPLEPLLAADVADYCLRAIGPGRVRLMGEELVHLTAPLLAAGCQVSAPEPASSGGPAADMAIAWAPDDDACLRALQLDVAVAVLVTRAEAAVEATAWIERASAKGWQLHPAIFALPGAPEGVSVSMFARKGIDTSSGMDMLRASYHGLAAALVRPGDAVLATDAAVGGLWRILQQQSRCSWLGVLTDSPAPAVPEQGVDWLAPLVWRQATRPVDVVITRLSHDGTDWIQELQEADAALVRSGRLVLQVPLDSGRNAQEGALLAALDQRGLAVDRAWWQSVARPPGLGQFIEVERDASERLAIDADRVAEADALVLMAVKTEGPGAMQDPAMSVPNIIAFQRDYLDASVVRLIVAMGLRLESAVLRRQVARRILDETPLASADHGAAICVLLYDPVILSGAGRNDLLAAAQRYIDTPAINPTMLRWQVSLTFAAAILHQANGDLLQAAEWYGRVLDYDVLLFSPLLGTKTTAAAARLGWIYFGNGDVAAARKAWSRGLDEARRLATQPAWSEVVGDPDAPETFAMQEFAAVMDEAGCLASALRLTAEIPLRPGMAWQWANRSWRSQLTEAHNAQQRRHGWQEQLQDAKDWLDGQYHLLTAELGRRTEAMQVLESDKRVMASEISGARAAFRLAHLHAAAEKTALRERLKEAEADYETLSAAHAQLKRAALNLTAATGVIMGSTPQAKLPAESIADEMSRLAIALNRLPLKRMVRAALRGLASLLGPR